MENSVNRNVSEYIHPQNRKSFTDQTNVNNRFGFNPKYAILLISILVCSLFIFNDVQAQSGKIVFKIKDKNNIPDVEGTLSKKGIKLKSADNQLNNTFDKYNVIRFEKLYPDSKRRELQKYYLLEAEAHNDLLDELKTSCSQMFSEVNEEPEPEALYEPNDYNFSMVTGSDGLREINLNYLDYINAPAAWDITKGDPNIIVGIHDNHLHTRHEDLEGKIFKVYDPNIRSTFYSDVDHGTMVAGIIAAKSDNRIGMPSVAFNCRLAKTSSNKNDLLRMAKEGVKVINISQYWGCYRADHQELINELVEDYGVTVVASAGNDDDDSYVYPASYDNVISVTSVGHEFERGTSFKGKKFNWKDCHRKYIDETGKGTCHQHNDKVDICAPGYNLITLCHPESYKNGLKLPTNQLYCEKDGTSFAAAIVSGVCALMYSVNPALTPNEVDQILKLTAANIDNIPENEPYKGLLGAGRIDAYEAIKMAQCWPNCTLTSSSNEKSEITLNAFPNPTFGSLTLEFSTLDTRTIEILLQNGNRVYQSVLYNTSETIDLGNFSNGVYILRVFSNNHIVVKKIIKQ